MPSWIVPSDTHVIADTGHTIDHDRIADDLTLVATAFPGVTTGVASTAHNTLDDGSGNLTATGNITSSGGSFDATQAGSGQFDGTGFNLYNTAAGLGNQGGIAFFNQVNNAGGTHGAAVINQISHTGAYVGTLMVIDLNAQTITFEVPTLTANNTLDDGSGNMTVAGALSVSTVGKGLKVAEGSNAKQGTLTLNGTTAVVVSNTSVTANSRIFLTIQSPGGTVGSPYVSARTAGTSFSVKSTVSGDTSTCAYFITELA